MGAFVAVDGSTFNIAVDTAGTTLGVKISTGVPPIPTATNVNVTVNNIIPHKFTVQSKKALLEGDWTAFIATLSLLYVTTIFTIPGTLGPAGNISVTSGLATKTTVNNGTPVILKTTTFTLTMLVVTPATNPSPATDIPGTPYTFDVTITNANQTKYTSV